MADAKREILEMAVIGLESQRSKIEERIAEIQKQLGVRTPKRAVSGDGTKPKRQMSAKGKAAIRAALKKRWDEFHAKAGKPAAKKAGVKKAAPKRKLSPDARARLAANLAKARAAKAAKRAAKA